MGTSFERWEKDPFFSAAEEVQESADRMESVYRLWVQERRDGSKPTDELRRELHTVLGTAKWQLEELERAVSSNDAAWSAGEDTRARHRQFVAAIRDRIWMVENSLRGSNLEEGEAAALSWVRLDEGERDELALFLSCSLVDRHEATTSWSASDSEAGNHLPTLIRKASTCCSKNYQSNESSSSGTKEERVHGHQSTMSASVTNDFGPVKILVSSEESAPRLLDEGPGHPPPRIVSFSGPSSAVESATKTRWYRNGFRKWKGGHQHDAAESIPLRNNQLSQGIDACYERGKSCLSNCDESYEKELNGWAGAIHRQLQRSQYQIQYGRSVKMIVWPLLAVLLIVIFVLHAN